MKNEHLDCESVLIFRTNLHNKKDVMEISTLLNTENGIIKWNVDLSDIDNVLRIESSQIRPIKIIQLLTAAGYSCEELQD